MRELSGLTGGDIHGIDLRLAPRILRVGHAQATEHDALAVRHPAKRAVVEVPGRYLAWRAAAVRRQDEDVRAAILDVALSIAAVIQLLYDTRWLDPLCSLRWRGHRDAPIVACRYEHRKSEPLAVGRPLQTGRILGEMR